MQTLKHAPKKSEAIFLIRYASLTVRLVLSSMLVITFMSFLGSFLSYNVDGNVEQSFKLLSVALLSLLITLVIYYASIGKILVETIISDVNLMNDIIDDYNYVVNLYNDLESKYIKVRDERNEVEEKLVHLETDVEKNTNVFKMTLDEYHKVIDERDEALKVSLNHFLEAQKEIERLKFENNSFRKELELTTPRKEN